MRPGSRGTRGRIGAIRVSTLLPYPHRVLDADGEVRIDGTRYKVAHLAGDKCSVDGVLARKKGFGLESSMEVSPMKTMTITITMPDQVELPFGASEQDFARELRLAAAIHWYDRGLISQGRGAEIAGLTRSDLNIV